MNIKITTYHHLWIVILVLLSACGTTTPATSTLPSVIVTPAVESPTALKTFTPDIYSETDFTPSPAVTSAVLPKFQLDGYVMAYPKEDGLYFQDGDNPPVKFAKIDYLNDKKPHDLVLSDDNQNAAFSITHDSDYDVVLSANTDETQNINLVLPLDDLESGLRLGGLTFIPNTHQLLIEAVLCKWQENDTPCFVSLYVSDTDTGKYKKIAYLGLADKKDSDMSGTIPKNIVISPDGKMLAAGTMSGIQIYDLAGNVIRKNILPYESNSTYDIFPTLSWLPDSRGLIFALPNTSAESNVTSYRFPASTIWRYMIDGNSVTQIQMDAIPLNDVAIFPNGNWIIYREANSPWLHLASLLDGHTKMTWAGSDMKSSKLSLSPGSKYFMQNSKGSGLLGIVGEPSINVTETRANLVLVCGLRAWVDVTHYTCELNGGVVMAEINSSGAVKTYDLGFDGDIKFYIFIKLK